MISSSVDITIPFNQNSTYTADVAGCNFTCIQVVGTPSATINLTGSIDNVNFTTIQATNLSAGTAASTIAAAGMFEVIGHFNYLKLAGTSATTTKIVLLFSKIK